jgi:hypothetical protein
MQLLFGINQTIYKDIFLTSIGQVKAQYSVTVQMLVIELDQCFANSKLMNAFNIMYPEF